jgi:hypothetical protein
MLIRHTPRIHNAAQKIWPNLERQEPKLKQNNSDQLFIQDARTIPKDQGFPKGGFVFYDGSDPRNEHLSNSVACSFSDQVLRPSLFCHVGFLSGTKTFFTDTIRLTEFVLASIAKETELSFGAYSPTSPQVQVYFGTHSLRTFLFALHHQKKSSKSQTPRPVTFAGSLQLEFRRFKEELTWQDFQEGVRQFLEFLDLTDSEIVALTPLLRRFCDTMCKMRYRTPFSVPQTLPWEDLQRRFGVSIRRLWSHWMQEDDAFQPWCPWKQTNQNIDPLKLKTHFWECVEWEQAHSVSLSKLNQVIEDTFLLLLSKLSQTTQTKSLGLRSFIIHITFNDGIEKSYPVHLACTLHKISPEATNLIRKVTERLPQRKTEVLSKQDPSFFVTLTHALEVSIEPMDLVNEEIQSTQWNLFHGAEPKTLEEVCFSLNLKSKDWHLEKSFMVANLEPETGVSSKGTHMEWEALKLESQHTKKSPLQCSLFEAAQNWRPIAFLKKPVALDLVKFDEFKKNYVASDDCYFEYAETFLNQDFYWLTPCDDAQPKLWLQTPTHQRTLKEEHRNYEWVGFDL